jgi:hypothetical protein
VIREILAMRSRFGKVIHLSDGGHFENLGVFELLRRGCRRIIVIDASCDPDSHYSDLANAIRRAQIDLGVRILGELDRIDAGPDRKSPRRSWTWFEIDYGNDLPKGRLLYVKPSVDGKQSLPPEVLQYSMRSSAFPHESTVDQFFQEAQMEAYRSLGRYCMDEAIEAIMHGPDPEDQDAYLYGTILRGGS